MSRQAVFVFGGEKKGYGDHGGRPASRPRRAGEPVARGIVQAHERGGALGPVHAGCSRACQPIFESAYDGDLARSLAQMVVGSPLDRRLAEQ